MGAPFEEGPSFPRPRRVRQALVLAGFVLAVLCGAARAQSWGEEKSSLTSGPQYAASKAVCRKLEGREPPDADRPTPAQSRALKNCDSETLYYGEGRAPDYAKARMCAFMENDGGKGSSRTDGVFAGQTILMQLYANGLGGVRRDLDQATAYACDIEGAPAEIDGRVSHLQALKAKPSAKRFDYCDNVTSGLAEGFCAARDAEIAKKGRAAKTAGLEATIPPAARPAFAALKRASDAFVNEHGGGEVDMSGTARAAIEIGEEEATRDRFLKHIDALLHGQWPSASPAQARAADAALNAAYRKALAYLPSKENFSTVKADDVRTAQRAWIAYRDAFVKFAAAASPGVTADAVVTLLTKERTEDLKGLAA